MELKEEEDGIMIPSKVSTRDFNAVSVILITMILKNNIDTPILLVTARRLALQGAN